MLDLPQLIFMTFRKSIANAWCAVILAGIVNTKWCSLDGSYLEHLSPVPAIFVKLLGLSPLILQLTAEYIAIISKARQGFKLNFKALQDFMLHSPHYNLGVLCSLESTVWKICP